MAKNNVIELYPRPTKQEYQQMVADLYDSKPDIFLILTAHRTENEDGDEGYEVNHVFYADSRDDFIQILELVIEEAEEEE